MDMMTMITTLETMANKTREKGSSGKGNNDDE